MTLIDEALAGEMASWEAAGLRRRLGDDADEGGGADFSSNDYLGLAGHPDVIAAARDALASHGAGGRASRLLGGGSPAHEAAERAAADWLGAESALLFPSGYQANLGVVTALAGRGDAVFSDRLNHASLIDAARLSRARTHVYRHLDLEELDRMLARERGARRRLVVTESVFSMDGDAAPLDELDELCRRHAAWLVLDEAHAAGLLGPEGAGAWGRRTSDRLVARIVTGGKALGVCGAFAATSAVLREHLLNRARAFVFTTAPTPATAGALVRAIGLCRAGDDLRESALGNARALAEGLGLPRPAAAVVPAVLGGSDRAVEAAAALRKQGIDARAVRPPSVPEGTARLRLACHATNTPAEIDEVVRHLRDHVAGDPPPVEAPAHPALFVVGTDTGIGKTVVAALLLRAAKRLGTARYWKPVQTGSDDDTRTVGALAGAEPQELLRPGWSLPLPASPHEAAADAGAEIEPARLEEGLCGLQRLVPEARVVVELAGGLLVPYTMPRGGGREGFTQADWLERAGASIVLVARSGLGTLNHTLLTLEALRARHLEPRALVLVGSPHDSNRETLRRMGFVERVFELPPLEPLDTAALDRWLETNDLAPVLEP